METLIIIGALLNKIIELPLLFVGAWVVSDWIVKRAPMPWALAIHLLWFFCLAASAFTAINNLS